jgi:hypothetical protein
MYILSLWAPPKDWVDFDLKIHKVGQQERFIVDGDVTFHWKNN